MVTSLRAVTVFTLFLYSVWWHNTGIWVPHKCSLTKWITELLNAFHLIFVVKYTDIYHLNRLSGQFRGIRYIHTVGQWASTSMSRAFSSAHPMSLLTLHSLLPLATAVLLSLSLWLPQVPYVSRILFVLLWLSSFTEHNIFKVHWCCSVCQLFPSFLRLNNIPWSLCTRFCYPPTWWWTCGLLLPFRYCE